MRVQAAPRVPGRAAHSGGSLAGFSERLQGGRPGSLAQIRSWGLNPANLPPARTNEAMMFVQAATDRSRFFSCSASRSAGQRLGAVVGPGREIATSHRGEAVRGAERGRGWTADRRPRLAGFVPARRATWARELGWSGRADSRGPRGLPSTLGIAFGDSTGGGAGGPPSRAVPQRAFGGGERGLRGRFRLSVPRRAPRILCLTRPGRTRPGRQACEQWDEDQASRALGRIGGARAARSPHQSNDVGADPSAAGTCREVPELSPARYAAAGRAESTRPGSLKPGKFLLEAVRSGDVNSREGRPFA